MKKIRHKIYTVSKKAGDRFGFDLPYFVENGFWMLLNQAVILLAGLVSSVFFARYFSKEVYGQYQFILSIIAFFSFFSIPGLNTALIRSVAKGFEGDYKKSVYFSVKFSLLGSCAIIITAIYYLIINENTTAIALALAAVLFPFIFSLDKWQAVLKGREKFEAFTKRMIIQSVGKTTLIFAAIIFFPNSLIPVIFAWLIGTVLFNFIWHLSVLKMPKNNKKAQDTFPYAKFITKLSILNTLVNNFDKILIGILDIQLLAVYSIALGLINIIKSFIKSVSAITFPKFAKNNISLSLKQKLIIFIAGLIITIILYFLSEDFIRILYTEKYINSASYFNRFIFIIPIFMLSSILSKKMLATKEKNKLIHLKLTVPLITLFSSVSVYLFTKNLTYFIFTKFFVFNILNYVVLIVPFKEK